MGDCIEQAIVVLNRIHQNDPTVLPALIEYRVACNEAVADDPTVQVGVRSDGDAEVGLLGIINGLFGVNERGWGYIGAVYGEDATLRRFERTPDD